MTSSNLAVQRQIRDMGNATETAEHALDPPEHASRLAHHFDTMKQQYEAAKLGMWLFLATEVLLFGGLFVAYAVFRGTHPDLFAWGSQFLDVNYGATNTVVLIISSLTMALAVSLAQLNHRWPVVITLSITFLCGVIFLAVKSVEYEHKFHDNLVWGLKFYEIPEGFEGSTGTGGAAVLNPGVASVGINLWNRTCRACHGVAGEGVVGQGRDIRESEYIQTRDDLELVTYINEGRLVTDPLNTTGLPMPPRGGNPMFNDQDLMHIVAYVRTFQIPIESEETNDADPENPENPGADDASSDGDAASDDSVDSGDDSTDEPSRAEVGLEPDPVAAAPTGEVTEAEFFIPFSSVPLASVGPAGFNASTLAMIEGEPPLHEPEAKEDVHHSVDPQRPANAHLFFGFYFIMTGLHGLHVLGGMGLIAWLIFRTVMGHFGRNYYTPIDLGGLYWHIVDLIWIFLFPMFYLIS